jgi:hypothetical protein
MSERRTPVPSAPYRLRPPMELRLGIAQSRDIPVGAGKGLADCWGDLNDGVKPGRPLLASSFGGADQLVIVDAAPPC